MLVPLPLPWRLSLLQQVEGRRKADLKNVQGSTAAGPEVHNADCESCRRRRRGRRQWEGRTTMRRRSTISEIVVARLICLHRPACNALASFNTRNDPNCPPPAPCLWRCCRRHYL